MNYKTTNKYFTQKNTVMYIGIGIAGLGIILAWLWFGWMLGAAIIAIGAACIVINREGLVKGEEVDAELAKKTTEFEEETIKAYNIVRSSASIISFSDYVFDGENAASMRKGTDGKFRPKKAISTCLFTVGEKLIVEKKAFSIVEDSETESSSTFAFQDIAPLAITEKELEDEGGVLVKYRMLEIKDREGNLLAQSPVPQNSMIYDSISDINREIKASHKAAK